MKWTYHGQVSSEVDSSGIPVGLLKEKKGIITEKMFLQSKSKFSPIEQFIYLLSRCHKVNPFLKFFILYNKYGDISTTVVDIHCSIDENLNINFVYLLMLNNISISFFKPSGI